MGRITDYKKYISTNTNIKILIRYLKDVNLYDKFKNYSYKLTIEKTLKRLMNNYSISPFFTEAINIATNKNYNTNINKSMFKDFESLYYKIKYNKTKKQLFDEFLKTYDIYNTFYKEKNKNKPHNEYDVKNNLTRLGMMINDSFTWENTKHGFEFWCNHHQNLLTYEKKLFHND